MVPITNAMMAVLPALAGDTVEAAVKDACDGLKAVIRRKWGRDRPYQQGHRRYPRSVWRADSFCTLIS